MGLPGPQTTAAIGAALVCVGTILAIATLPEKWKRFRFLSVVPIGFGSVIGLGQAYEGKALGLSVYWLVIAGVALLIIFLILAAHFRSELFDERWIDEKRCVEDQKQKQQENPDSGRVRCDGCNKSHTSTMWATGARKSVFGFTLVGGCLIALLALAIAKLSTDQLTAIGTLALAVFSAATIWSSRSQTKATREATEATQRSAEATLREAKQLAEQVRIGQAQVEASEKQNRTGRRQVEIAQQSLDAQSVPRLIPDGGEYYRFTGENGHEGPRKSRFLAVYLSVINAGNGAAIIDTERSRAGGGIELDGVSGMDIVVPPALAAGGRGEIKLLPLSERPVETRIGMVFEVEIPYSAFASPEQTETLRFRAQYFAEHWLVKVIPEPS